MESKPPITETLPIAHRHTPFRRFNKGTRDGWGVSREELKELIAEEKDPYRKAGLIRGWALTSDDPKAKAQTEALQDKLQQSEDGLKPSEMKYWIDKLVNTALFASAGAALLKGESLLGSVDNFDKVTKETSKRLGLEGVRWEKADKPISWATGPAKGRKGMIGSYPSIGNIGYQGGLEASRQRAQKILKTPLARHLNLVNKALPLGAAATVIGSNSPWVEDNSSAIIGASLAPLAVTELSSAAKGAKAVKSLRPFLPALATLSTGGILAGLSAKRREQEDNQFKKETENSISQYIKNWFD